MKNEKKRRGSAMESEQAIVPRARAKKRRLPMRALRLAARASKILLIGILLLVIVLSCITIVRANLHPNQIPDVLGYQVLTVTTGSMRPALNPGDLVLDRIGGNTDSLKAGRIATYRSSDGALVTHRIAKADQSGGATVYTFRGDANPAADAENVPAARVVGIYAGRCPLLGYVLLFLRSRLGIELLIILPVAAVLTAEGAASLRRLRRKAD